ncbi:MAG: leucine-rich repeat protein [Alistipes sp.]|nr:leucine-rich repeat protein [Alistipes sp.]
MKKKLLYGLCCAALFVGCTKDPNEVFVPQGEQIPIQLLGSIDQIAASRVNDNGFCNGDGVGVYVVNYEGESAGTMLSEGNQVDNVRYVYNESENKWTPDYPVYYYDKVTPVDIIGYYPYVTNVENVNAYSFELAKDQSTDAANGLMGGYEASDFLWGKAEKITPTESRVNITFNHKMAGVQVELVEGTGWSENEWVGLDKQILVSNTIRKATIDLATGEVAPIGEVPTTGTIPAKNNDSWRAVVVPQTVEASVALFNITVDGTPYVYRYKVDGAPTAFEYFSGKLHKFTIEVSKKEQQGLEFKLIGEAITPWESETITHDGTAREYVVVNVPKASTEKNISALKAAIEASGKDYTKIKNLKITGETNINDFYFMRDEMSILQSVNMKECVVVENEIPQKAFYKKATLTSFVFPKEVISIGPDAFHHTNLMGALIIPEGVKSIGEGESGGFSFAYCAGLTSLSLPSTLEYIGEQSFSECRGLSGTLSIPSNVKFIGKFAFDCCSGFTGDLNLPKNLEHLGNRAFSYCTGLTGSLIIPEKITVIEEKTFIGCGFDGTLKLPHNLLIIGSSAFYGCGFQGTLELPEGLISIGRGAFNENRFSGELRLPSTLTQIDTEAFRKCFNLTGVVELPKDILMVPANCFEECKQLEGVILPKGLEHIQSGAFKNCYQLGAITSHALVPPTVASDAFNGVAKDNFTVEVPEVSVNDYVLAPVWKEFKRFSAWRDFSVSRNLFRSLNASNSKTIVLRALSDAEWSVESKPEWVTVEPMSGIGKTEVTITVNEMSAGDVGTFKVESYTSSGSTTSTTYNGRAGEVVFLLNGKDYRTRTKIEQYDYKYGDGTVITNQTATEGNGVNIVFMGDCFDAQDIATGKYLNGVNEAIDHFFAVEPYKTYKSYFNIYTVFGLSADSGVGSVNTIREAKFGSQYGLQAAGSVGVDENVCFEYACKTPTVTTDNICQTPIVLIENTHEYDGITYMWGDGSAIALVPMSQDAYPYDFRGVLQHEAGGHAFGKLGDEYIYHNAFIETCTCDCCDHTKEFNTMKSYGFYANLALTGNMYKVPWSHLIFDEKYQNTVDVYEGGFFHTRGVFRSEQNSCMNNNIPYFSAISRQAIVERIMKYAGEQFSFEEWKARDKGLATDEPATASTRSIPFTSSYEPVQTGHAPKFMGEKPVLNF